MMAMSAPQDPSAPTKQHVESANGELAPLQLAQCKQASPHFFTMERPRLAQQECTALQSQSRTPLPSNCSTLALLALT